MGRIRLLGVMLTTSPSLGFLMGCCVIVGLQWTLGICLSWRYLGRWSSRLTLLSGLLGQYGGEHLQESGENL